MHTLPHSLSSAFAPLRDEAEIQNLLNTDMYKFLMLDFILAHPEYRTLHVRWKMTVRDPRIHLAQVIPIECLREQFDSARAIHGVSPADISYLRGMTTQSGKPLFREETLRFLTDFELPEYSLHHDGTGGYDISFE